MAKIAFQVGDKVQLREPYVKNVTKFDGPHASAFKAGAGTGIIITIFPGGSLAIDWENDFHSAVMPARNVKIAK